MLPLSAGTSNTCPFPPSLFAFLSREFCALSLYTGNQRSPSFLPSYLFLSAFSNVFCTKHRFGPYAKKNPVWNLHIFDLIRRARYIGLATERLRVLSIPPNDGIRNRLVAKPMVEIKKAIGWTKRENNPARRHDKLGQSRSWILTYPLRRTILPRLFDLRPVWHVKGRSIIRARDTNVIRCITRHSASVLDRNKVDQSRHFYFFFIFPHSHWILSKTIIPY